MLAIDDVLQTFVQLSAGERLIWIDSWASLLVDFSYDPAGEWDRETARRLLHIGRMLKVIREDLAMVDDPSNRVIIARVWDIISMMRIGASAAAIIPYFGKPQAVGNQPWPESDLLPSP